MNQSLFLAIVIIITIWGITGQLRDNHTQSLIKQNHIELMNAINKE